MDIEWNPEWLSGDDRSILHDQGISFIEGDEIATITGCEKGSDRITITTKLGRAISLFHTPDCCESVEVVDVVGDPDDLIGAYVTGAREETNVDHGKPDEYSESYTWTFYVIETNKGSLTIRWLGESNGYYSESVDCNAGLVRGSLSYP